MSTFEEQFPSLKLITPYLLDIGTHTYNVYEDKDIQKHCLDKQKVREILQDYLENGSFDQKIVCQRIIKELGL